MPFPAGCSDHDFSFLYQLFKQQAPAKPFAEDEARLVKAGWLHRDHTGELAVTDEVSRHFRAVWKPIVRDTPSRGPFH